MRNKLNDYVRFAQYKREQLNRSRSHDSAVYSCTKTAIFDSILYMYIETSIQIATYIPTTNYRIHVVRTPRRCGYKIIIIIIIRFMNESVCICTLTNIYNI